MSASLEHVRDLVDFVTESPTSFHAAAEGSRRLVAAGFTKVDERVGFVAAPGAYVLVRDGAVLAWRHPGRCRPRHPVPDRRRPHRLTRLRAEASARRRNGRLAAAGDGDLRRPAAQLLAGPRARAGRSGGPHQRRTAAGPHRGDHAHPAAGHPPRPVGERGGREAGPPAAHRAGLERQPPRSDDHGADRPAGRLRGRRHRRFRPVGVRRPRRRRSSDPPTSSWPRAGWTTCAACTRR